MIMRIKSCGDNHMTVDRMYKDFNIVGKEVEIKLFDAPDSMWNDYYMPAIVTDEHRKFITVEIQPHKNPYSNYGMSKPYPMCINKSRIWLGSVILVVDGMRFKQ